MIGGTTIKGVNYRKEFITPRKLPAGSVGVQVDSSCLIHPDDSARTRDVGEG